MRKGRLRSRANGCSKNIHEKPQRPWNNKIVSWQSDSGWKQIKGTRKFGKSIAGSRLLQRVVLQVGCFREIKESCIKV